MYYIIFQIYKQKRFDPMAHNNFSNGINNNHHRMDSYEYELKRLMEQERRSMAVQVRHSSEY